MTAYVIGPANKDVDLSNVGPKDSILLTTSEYDRDKLLANTYKTRDYNSFEVTKRVGDLYETWEEAEAKSNSIKEALKDGFKKQIPDANSLIRFMYAHNMERELENREREQAVREQANELFGIDINNPTFEVDMWDGLEDDDFDDMSTDEEERIRRERIDEYKSVLTDATSIIEFMYGYGIGEESEDLNLEARTAVIESTKELFGVDITGPAVAGEPDIASFPYSKEPVNTLNPMSAAERWAQMKAEGTVKVEYSASNDKEIEEQANDLADALDTLQKENSTLEM